MCLSLFCLGLLTLSLCALKCNHISINAVIAVITFINNGDVNTVSKESFGDSAVYLHFECNTKIELGTITPSINNYLLNALNMNRMIFSPQKLTVRDQTLSAPPFSKRKSHILFDNTIYSEGDGLRKK